MVQHAHLKSRGAASDNPEWITIKTWRNLYVRACNAHYEPYNWGLDAPAEVADDWERFHVFYHDNNQISLKSAFGNWVNAEGNGDLQNKEGNSEQFFTRHITGDGKWGFHAMVDKYGKYWSADSNEAHSVRAVANSLSGWEAFIVEPTKLMYDTEATRNA